MYYIDVVIYTLALLGAFVPVLLIAICVSFIYWRLRNED